jgi:hypothetical protein
VYVLVGRLMFMFDFLRSRLIEFKTFGQVDMINIDILMAEFMYHCGKKIK